MSQPSYPRFARLGSGARRAMWRELETMWTNSPKAWAARDEQEVKATLGIPLQDIPLLSPEPDEVFSCECVSSPAMGTSDFSISVPFFPIPSHE